jgi:hypothetical protein
MNLMLRFLYSHVGIQISETSLDGRTITRGKNYKINYYSALLKNILSKTFLDKD